MRRRSLLSHFIITYLISLALPCKIVAQPAEFGAISAKDFQVGARKDTAAAIVLFDKGELKIDPNSTSGTVFRRHVRLKIMRKEGLAHWASNRIFVGTDGHLKVRGATFNYEDGKIIKSEISDENVIKTKHNKYFEIVSVEFPKVKEGAIVELSYTETYSDLYIPNWQFQYTIPVDWSEYTVTVPVEKIQYHHTGEIPLYEHVEKYQGKYHHWVMKDIPAFTAEPMMPDKDVYISQIKFATRFSSWEGVYHVLAAAEDFGAIVHKHRSLTSLSEKITANVADEKLKIKAISDYIKANVQFNGVMDFTGSDPDKLLEKKSGTSGDINLLFGSLLEKAGFEVEMVLLSTRSQGLALEELPTLRQFNYVICRTKLQSGQFLLLDATEKLLPYDLLPQRCFNFKGFVISSAKYGWIEIETKDLDRIKIEAHLSLHQNGALSGKIKTIREDHAAFRAGQLYEKEPDKKTIDDIVTAPNEVQLVSIKNLGKSLEEEANVKFEDYATVSGDVIYLNPHLFLVEGTNPFTSSSRKYPVDFEKLTDHTVITYIELPTGYLIDELPKNKAQVIPGNLAKSTISFSLVGDKVIVISKLQINRSLFHPGDYPGLKEFYARLIASKAETIVLKRSQ